MEQVLQHMRRAERGTQNPLDDIEQQMRENIFGQERAIESIIRVLNRARFGFSAGNPRRPRATLLFLGPTGVGKPQRHAAWPNCYGPMRKPFSK